MEEIITNEELKNLRKIKGKVRGASINEIVAFIEKEEGKKRLTRLEEFLKNYGYEIEFAKVKPMSFYPIELEAAILLAMKKVFAYSEERFQELGVFTAKYSLVIRVSMGYLVSLERAAKEASKMWRKYFTIGDLKIIELNKEKKFAIIRIENFYHLHSACHYLKGYFSTLVKLMVKKTVECEETKCLYTGDKYHEFYLKW